MADKSWLQQYDPLGNTTNAPGVANPPAAAQPEKEYNDKSWMQQHDPLGNTGIKPPATETPPDTQPWYNYVGKGILENAPISPEEANYRNDPWALSPPPPESEIQKGIQNLVPTSENPTGAHRALEGAAKGATTGAMFGPSGAITGAISGATEGYTGSPWLGMLAGISTGTIGNLVQRAGQLGRDAFSLANSSLGLPGASVAEATDSWKRMYAWLMGSAGGSHITSAAADARNVAAGERVNQIADDVLGNSVTRTEAGSEIQNAALARVKADAAKNTAIIDDLSTRAAPRVDPKPYIDSLNAVLGSTAPGEEAVLAPATSSFLKSLEQGLYNTLARPGSDDLLGYDTVKALRTQIGYRMDAAMSSGDGTSYGQLSQIYAGLSRTMRGAYSGMDLIAFDKANLDMAQNFARKAQILNPLLKENLTPERIFGMTGNQAKIGATKMWDIRRAIGDDAWNEYASSFLRQMGLNREGQFDLATYSTRWNQLPEETQKALFARTPYADLPQGYKDLSMLADRYKNAGIFYNRPESGNTVNMGLIMKDFIHGLIGVGLGGTAGMGVHHLGNSSDMADAAAIGLTGMTALPGAVKAISAGTELYGSQVLAQLMTNPTFVKWAATEVPAKMFPRYLNALNSYIASHDPNMMTPFNVFTNYLHSKYPEVFTGIPKTDKPRTEEHGFLGGGYADFPNQYPSYAEGGSVNDLNLNSQEQFLYNMHQERLHGAGKTNNPDGSVSTLRAGTVGIGDKTYLIPFLWDNKEVDPKTAIDNASKMGLDKFPSYPDANTAEKRYQEMHKYIKGYAGGGPGAQWQNMSEGYALGGLTNTVEPVRGDYPVGMLGGGTASAPFGMSGAAFTGYAQGGISHNTNDPRPFYNPQLPNVVGGGWAEGGIANDNPITILPSILDALIIGNPRSGFTGRLGGGSGVQWDVGIPNSGLLEGLYPVNDNFAEGGMVPANDYVEPDIMPTLSVLDMFMAGTPKMGVMEKPGSGVEWSIGYEPLVGRPSNDNYAGGGLIPANDNNSVLSLAMKTMQPANPNTSFWDNPNTLRRLIDNPPANNYTPRTMYKKGGLVEASMNDSAQGGYITSSTMGYADGGSTDKVQFAADYLGKRLGIDPALMKGAVKYMAINESKLDPNIVNPTSGAYGIAQDLGPRLRDLKAIYGPKPSFEQQLDNIVRELTGPEGRVLSLLRNASTEKQVYDIWGKDFERPGNQALAKAGVSYNPGDVSADQSIIDSVMADEESNENDNPEEEQQEAGQHEGTINALNAAPWVSPEVKYAAGHILRENA